MTVVFSTLTSMTALDLEEVKDHVSRQDLAYRLLEESVQDFASQCERRFADSEKEKQSLLDKISQLEILLKSRQGALIAKESECKKLKDELTASAVRVYRPENEIVSQVGRSIVQNMEPIVDSCKTSKASTLWLSTCTGVARFESSCSTKLNLTVSNVAHNEVIFDFESSHRSPPPTAFRRELHSAAMTTDSSLSPPPRRSLMRRAPRESFGSSFASVRSSRTIRSISDDDSSDESLNELVSHAMRLSAASFRSSTSSSASVVRGSVDFPKRWK